MKMPPKSPDLEAGVDGLHQYYAALEKVILANIDELAGAGFSDRRMCAIARTDFEKAFMVLHRALRDYPGDDPNNYAKVPHTHPMPPQFTPPVDPEGHRQVASQRHIEWKDYGPDQRFDPPDSPDSDR